MYSGSLVLAVFQTAAVSGRHQLHQATFVSHWNVNCSLILVMPMISTCVLSFPLIYPVLFVTPSPRLPNLSLTHPDLHPSAHSTAALQGHTESPLGEPPPDASRRGWILSNPSLLVWPNEAVQLIRYTGASCSGAWEKVDLLLMKYAADQNI